MSFIKATINSCSLLKEVLHCWLVISIVDGRISWRPGRNRVYFRFKGSQFRWEVNLKSGQLFVVDAEGGEEGLNENTGPQNRMQMCPKVKFCSDCSPAAKETPFPCLAQFRVGTVSFIASKYSHIKTKLRTGLELVWRKIMLWKNLFLVPVKIVNLICPRVVLEAYLSNY